MRRLYYALPFLLIATGYVLWNVRITPGIIALFNWLTFSWSLGTAENQKKGKSLLL